MSKLNKKNAFLNKTTILINEKNNRTVLYLK